MTETTIASTKTAQRHNKVEQQLRESQALLAGIIGSAMDAIITIDEGQNILFFNAAAEQMFGIAGENIIGQPVEMLLPKRFRGSHREHIRRFGTTGVTNRTMGRLGRLYGLRESGEEFPIEASISQVQMEEGKLFTVIMRDITERVEFEERLMDSEQQLRAAFDQAAVGMAHLSPDGHWLSVNQKLCQIVGYSRDELVKLTLHEITHPDDLPADLNMQNQLLTGKIQVYSLEKRYIRKDGHVIWVNLTASLVRDSAGDPKYMIKLVEDITARKEAESQLRKKNDEIKSMTQQLWQTAKLATMGELAASIAHELNNPLAILSLRIENLLASADQLGSEKNELDIMEQEVDRMASLVANLLQFSRSGQRQISTMEISEEISKTLELIHTHLIHRHVTVVREFDPEAPMIHADRQQLRQLFLNLFSNASDAMPEGGTLTIRVFAVENRKKIVVEIKDTGMGIAAEDLGQVVEPFFTTKTEGKGTGLGLAICRRIVEEHNGALRISSPGLGKGALIEIVLPAINESKTELFEG